jgi:hypothetical protein
MSQNRRSENEDRLVDVRTSHVEWKFLLTIVSKFGRVGSKVQRLPETFFRLACLRAGRRLQANLTVVRVCGLRVEEILRPHSS